MQQLDHLKNLVVMASADGSLTEQEIALLIDRCSELGLAEEDLETAISFAMSGKAKLVFPVDRLEQNQMLSDLIRMMAADGKLSEVEKRLVVVPGDLVVDERRGEYIQVPISVHVCRNRRKGSLGVYADRVRNVALAAVVLK